MESAQKAVANPDAATAVRGQVCPQELKPEEETVHPPQSVGREFVRQYYTMLHQAPDQLHRFYSQNSSFLHERWFGSVIEEKPAIGQLEIYERINTLGFRDCHAKIFQVDSQLSVSQTVVVQVLGELSNDGRPLRKFMQTFVLVPQTNKKYYVHNDIFRYQDDDLGNEMPNEAEYNNGVTKEDQAGAVDQLNEALYVHQVEEEVMAAEVIAPNQESHQEDLVEDAETKVDSVDKSEQETPVAGPVDVQEEVEALLPEEKQEERREPENKDAASEPRESSLPPQKLSWAEMASRNVGSSFKPLPSKAESRNGNAQPTMPPANSVRSTPPPTAKSPPPPQQQQPVQQQNQKPVNFREHQQQPVSGGEEANNTPGRGMQFYPDQQQIFVGNLPHHMTDQDLKEFFEKYGKVMDIRINRKPNNSLPNFGFIAFESAETVKHILSLRPLYYNGRFRVNVEEKKRREDLIGARPRSGNPNARTNQFDRSPDRAVANGNFVPVHKEEIPKTGGQ